MKTLTKLTILLMILLVGGCSKENNIVDTPSDNEMSINAYKIDFNKDNEEQVKTNFNKGDILSLNLWRDNYSSNAVICSNIDYTNSDNNLWVKNNSTKLNVEGNCSYYNVVALFPKTNVNNLTSFILDESSKNLLIASNKIKADIFKKNKIINLDFKPLFSKINIVINASNTLSNLNIKRVYIEDGVVESKVDLTNSLFSSSKSDNIDFEVSDLNATHEIIPQNIKSIKIVAESSEFKEKTFIYNQDENIESGKKYDYTFDINQSSLTLKSINISPWGISEEINGSLNDANQFTLTTDFTDNTSIEGTLYNIWSVANRISPESGSNTRSDVSVNLIRFIGGILDKNKVPYIDYDICRYDENTKTYSYNFEPLYNRLDKVFNVSKANIFQIVLDQPDWAFQHSYSFIAKGQCDNVHFRENEKQSTYGNSLPPCDKDEYYKFIQELMRKLVERYGESKVLSWRFRIGSEIETPDHWYGTENDFIEHFANVAKAVRSILPGAKIGVHTRPTNFIYNSGKVLNYKSEIIKSFANGIIDYCYNNNLKFDFWGISDYILINDKDSRDISNKYNTLFAPLINNTKWNVGAKLDLMEFSSIVTMNGADGKGYINCETPHTQIVELEFANQFYKNHNKGLEYIFRWGVRPSDLDDINIRELNSMNGFTRYVAKISGEKKINSNEIHAFMAKGADNFTYDALIYNFNHESLDYKEAESVNLCFIVNLPPNTDLYYKIISYDRTNNKLEMFLDKYGTSYIKPKFDKRGTPSRTMDDAGIALYNSFPAPAEYNVQDWKKYITVQCGNDKNKSMIYISTNLPSFAFKKIEFRANMN